MVCEKPGGPQALWQGSLFTAQWSPVPRPRAHNGYASEESLLVLGSLVLALVSLVLALVALVLALVPLVLALALALVSLVLALVSLVLALVSLILARVSMVLAVIPMAMAVARPMAMPMAKAMSKAMPMACLCPNCQANPQLPGLGPMSAAQVTINQQNHALGQPARARFSNFNLATGKQGGKVCMLAPAWPCSWGSAW